MAVPKLVGDAFLAMLDAPTKPVKLGYVFREGVRTLSYSRLNTFYSCPRKFHIGEVKGARNFSPSVDTAFGHAYGMGVQTYLHLAETHPHEVALQRAVVAAISAYDYPDLWESKAKSKKDLWYAIIGVENFASQVAPQILADFKLAIIDGKPAIELLFLIQIDESYDYQGHMDLVLQNRHTGEYFVAEIKTSYADAQPADWANSTQTLGYNVVVHSKFPEQTNFNVLYICYNTTQLTTQLLSFSKSCAHRADFITSLLQDVEVMKMYDAHDYWPKRGNSCVAYGKPCYLFGTCDSTMLHTSSGDSYESLSMEDVDIVLSAESLVSAEAATISHEFDWSEV